MYMQLIMIFVLIWGASCGGMDSASSTIPHIVDSMRDHRNIRDYATAISWATIAEPNVTAKLGDTLLHGVLKAQCYASNNTACDAYAHARLYIVQQLLHNPSLDVNKKNNLGHTPLMIALQHAQIYGSDIGPRQDVIEALLSHPDIAIDKRFITNLLEHKIGIGDVAGFLWLVRLIPVSLIDERIKWLCVICNRENKVYGRRMTLEHKISFCKLMTFWGLTDHERQKILNTPWLF